MPDYRWVIKVSTAWHHYSCARVYLYCGCGKKRHQWVYVDSSFIHALLSIIDCINSALSLIHRYTIFLSFSLTYYVSFSFAVRCFPIPPKNSRKDLGHHIQFCLPCNPLAVWSLKTRRVRWCHWHMRAGETGDVTDTKRPTLPCWGQTQVSF